jgi:hypothetical protein
MQTAQTIPCTVVTVNPNYHENVSKISLPFFSNINLKFFGKFLKGPITNKHKNASKM